MSIEDLVYEPPTGEIITEINGNSYHWKLRGFTADEIENLASQNAIGYAIDPTTKKPVARLNYGVLRRHVIFEGVVEQPAIFEEWTIEVVQSLRSKVREQLWEGINNLSDDVELFVKKSKMLSQANP
ncbi:MAG: hypothetical protein KAQ99_05595, partial [Candidatus Aureabacteria bacterium]|nr:hypothetical protein [Candidatus Auribacterota bacterium]